MSKNAQESVQKPCELSEQKKNAFSKIVKSLEDFEAGLSQVGVDSTVSLISPFENLERQWASFLEGTSPEFSCPQVIQLSSAVCSRLIVCLSHITAEYQSLPAARDAQKFQVCKEIVNKKFAAPVKALREAFQKQSGWPAEPLWRALELALNELSECLFHLQFDTGRGTSVCLSNFFLSFS